MDVSLDVLWHIFRIWTSRWVSCVNIPNIAQLPVLLTAKWRKPCKRCKTQIARENGAEMTEPERASISRERKVARASGKYKASRMSNPITKTSV